jgi:hypothetical protein
MKSKTVMILTVLVLFSSLELFSQNFRFGFLAGMDITKSFLTNLPDNLAKSANEPMLSYNLNGYIGYKTAGFFGVSIEPGFIQKGYIQVFQENNVRFQLNYLQMPVFADIYFTDRLFLSVGPEIAYLLNARLKTISDKGDITGLYEKRFELSGIVGINYNIVKKFDTGLRYSRGFTYTSEINFTDANGHFITNSKEFNQYLQLIVRYRM